MQGVSGVTTINLRGGIEIATGGKQCEMLADFRSGELILGEEQRWWGKRGRRKEEICNISVGVGEK